jgi:acylphosphatase
MSKKMVKQIKISGRVQGVGFRYFTYKIAQEYGITGWVKNCTDGSVEALIAGEESDVEKMMKAISRSPAMAHVNRITELSSGVEIPDSDSFQIHR